LAVTLAVIGVSDSHRLLKRAFDGCATRAMDSVDGMDSQEDS
jgi:hypothetical protein